MMPKRPFKFGKWLITFDKSPKNNVVIIFTNIDNGVKISFENKSSSVRFTDGDSMQSFGLIDQSLVAHGLIIVDGDAPEAEAYL